MNKKSLQFEMGYVWSGEIKYMHVCAVVEVVRDCCHFPRCNMYRFTSI